MMKIAEDFFALKVRVWDVCFQLYVQNRWPKLELSGGITLTPAGKTPMIQVSVSLLLVRFNLMSWIELDPAWRKK